MCIHRSRTRCIALDLDQDGKIVWKYEPKQDPDVIPVMCCDTVYRGLGLCRRQDLPAPGRHHARRARRQDRRRRVESRQRRSEEGRDRNVRSDGHQGQGHRRHFRWRVRRAVPRHRLRPEDRRQSLARLFGRPDEQLLVDPEKTTALGKPIGKDSSSRPGKAISGRSAAARTWGWFAYDPEPDLFYYGTGNPSTWNPKQRPGDKKWSMTIFARDPDAGMAKWVYQMTPHDEWDYDGVNEMILADIAVGGQETQGARALRPQRPRLHARTVRPANCWWPTSTTRR